ncbi:hypothetical protein DASC09_024700 [Saccharomycopsis crataegensis]|uniref:RING-type E3 ubiquitin transferase n=1 Tax=Saccharomycopsis crataegensis TaxID=43959 RepID=A0AAV5QKU5_9ASCO|nr:hypothetical protein DASC09_024700 [Saccharomycopsis crataegensis]
MGPSMLPMTAILQWYDPYFNKTSRDIGRYAAFGPTIDIEYPYDDDSKPLGIISQQPLDASSSEATPPKNQTFFAGDLVFIKHNGCNLKQLEDILKNNPRYDPIKKKFDRDVMVLNQRGGCAFYDKILNFQKSGAKTVIIGNDQENKGLITMFSRILPEDIVIPSIFVTKETMMELGKLINASSDKSISLKVFSGQTPSPLLDALLTLVFSPPIALSILYVVMKIRRSHKKSLDKAPKNAVRNLPVYVFNADYLIPIDEFEKKREYYSGGTANDNNNNNNSKTSSNMLLNLFKKSNGKSSLDPGDNLSTDSESLEHSIQRHLSIEELNQYQMNQCSICLAAFRKLKSKVVLLPCGHYFHYKCCLNWLCNYHKVCPICKHDITKKVKRASVGPRRSSSIDAARSTIRNIFRYNGNAEDPDASTGLMVDRGTSPGISNSNSMNYNSLDNPTNVVQQTHLELVIEDSITDMSSNDVDFLEYNSEENQQELRENEHDLPEYLDDEERSIGSRSFY